MTEKKQMVEGTGIIFESGIEVRVGLKPDKLDRVYLYFDFPLDTAKALAKFDLSHTELAVFMALAEKKLPGILDAAKGIKLKEEDTLQ